MATDSYNSFQIADALARQGMAPDRAQALAYQIGDKRLSRDETVQLYDALGMKGAALPEGKDGRKDNTMMEDTFAAGGLAGGIAGLSAMSKPGAPSWMNKIAGHGLGKLAIPGAGAMAAMALNPFDESNFYERASAPELVANLVGGMGGAYLGEAVGRNAGKTWGDKADQLKTRLNTPHIPREPSTFAEMDRKAAADLTRKKAAFEKASHNQVKDMKKLGLEARFTAGKGSFEGKLPETPKSEQASRKFTRAQQAYERDTKLVHEASAKVIAAEKLQAKIAADRVEQAAKRTAGAKTLGENIVERAGVARATAAKQGVGAWAKTAAGQAPKVAAAKLAGAAGGRAIGTAVGSLGGPIGGIALGTLGGYLLPKLFPGKSPTVAQDDGEERSDLANAGLTAAGATALGLAASPLLRGKAIAGINKVANSSAAKSAKGFVDDAGELIVDNTPDKVKGWGKAATGTIQPHLDKAGELAAKVKAPIVDAHKAGMGVYDDYINKMRNPNPLTPLGTALDRAKNELPAAWAGVKGSANKLLNVQDFPEEVLEAAAAAQAAKATKANPFGATRQHTRDNDLGEPPVVGKKKKKTAVEKQAETSRRVVQGAANRAGGDFEQTLKNLGVR